MECDAAWNVPDFILGGIDVDFDRSNSGIIQLLPNPVGAYQNIGAGVVSQGSLTFDTV